MKERKKKEKKSLTHFQFLCQRKWEMQKIQPIDECMQAKMAFRRRNIPRLARLNLINLSAMLPFHPLRSLFPICNCPFVSFTRTHTSSIERKEWTERIEPTERSDNNAPIRMWTSNNHEKYETIMVWPFKLTFHRRHNL